MPGKKSVQVNFRIDEAVRDQMQEVCDELGISMSTAFQMFAAAVARGRCIPLDLSLDNAAPHARYRLVKLEE